MRSAVGWLKSGYSRNLPGQKKSWRFSGKWMQPRNGFMVRYYRSVWEQPAESGLYSFYLNQLHLLID